jgi:hypothetical protein
VVVHVPTFDHLVTLGLLSSTVFFALACKRLGLRLLWLGLWLTGLRIARSLRGRCDHDTQPCVAMSSSHVSHVSRAPPPHTSTAAVLQPGPDPEWRGLATVHEFPVLWKLFDRLYLSHVLPRSVRPTCTLSLFLSLHTTQLTSSRPLGGPTTRLRDCTARLKFSTYWWGRWCHLFERLHRSMGSV